MHTCGTTRDGAGQKSIISTRCAGEQASSSGAFLVVRDLDPGHLRRAGQERLFLMSVPVSFDGAGSQARLVIFRFESAPSTVVCRGVDMHGAIMERILR